MKSIKLSAFFLFFLSLYSNATHIVGGSLKYLYNGGSSYTVTLTLYRDCASGSAAFPASVTITVGGYNGEAFSPVKDFNMTLGPVTDVSGSGIDTCLMGSNTIPCVQEGIYTTTVNNLPPNPGGYHLYYQVCCRNLSNVNVNSSCNCIGSSIYAYIPGRTPVWFEDFLLANGTTVDAGATAWTRTLGTIPPTSAQVNNNLFEVVGANNAQVTWTSQVINIAPYTNGVVLSANLFEAGNMDAGDSIKLYYSLNGGPYILFPTNGSIADDFTSTIASTGSLTGNTIQLRVYTRSDNNSPTSEIYRFDNVVVSKNDFVTNGNPEFTTTPPLFLCAGSPFSYDFSASDPDGDSLAYSFYTPYTDVAPAFPSNIATFTPVSWESGYSATSPLGASIISLNPSTGTISGVPAWIGNYIVGIKVKEYRNSTLLSEVVQDFQLMVINCPIPATAVINSSEQISVCDTLGLTFPNNTSGNVNSWLWDFGDGSTLADTSTLKFPSYTYPSTGNYIVRLITNPRTNCADTATATVKVSIGSNSVVNAVSCSSYTLNSQVYTATGTYTQTLTNAAGCDSIITLNLTINPGPTLTGASQAAAVCAGSGATINLAGLLANSISTINYSINGIAQAAITGITANASGAASFTSSNLTAANNGQTLQITQVTTTSSTPNCSQSFTQNVTLSVNPVPALTGASQAAAVCAGSGATINLTGLLANSTSTINYSINGVAQTAVTGITANASGAASFTSANLTAANNGQTLQITQVTATSATPNCSKSFTQNVTLSVNPVPALTGASQAATVCAGSGATINLTGLLANSTSTINYTISGVAQTAVTGITANASGAASFTSANLAAVNNGQTLHITQVTTTSSTPNCSQSFTQNVTLSVNPVPALTGASQSATVCAGSGAIINLTGLLASSTSTINYTINGAAQAAITGITANASGAASFTSANLTAANNGQTLQVTQVTATSASPDCSQSFTQNVMLSVNSPSAGTDVITACDSHTWIDGVTYTADNSTATKVLVNAAGCDSTVTLNLNINNSSTGMDVQTACDSLTWINGVTYYSSNNTPTYILTGGNAAGCDSTLTLNLTINNSSAGTAVITACDSYTWIDGINYTSGNNTATFDLTNAAGCDSTVTLNLTINNSSTGTDVQTACATYTWIDGNTYTSGNSTAIFVIPNAAGCDSTVTLNLTINNTTGTDVLTACDSLTWIDGITYTSGNSTATYTLLNAAGCDSLVTLNLTINNSTSGTDIQTSCNSLTWIDGLTYYSDNSTATYNIPGGNAAGCDSIVTLSLTIGAVDTSVTQTGNTLTSNVLGAAYQWLDCDNSYSEILNEINQSFTTTVSGSYAVIVTEGSCSDTSACLNVTITGIAAHAETNLTIYPNPNNGSFVIKANVEGAYSLVNKLGQVVRMFEINAAHNYTTTIENLDNGVYFVLSKDKALLKQKIVVVR
ncbi:MAG TPA: PKD domain-containing protein [Bacteroidia bacterium]|jgi:hypothetical protein